MSNQIGRKEMIDPKKFRTRFVLGIFGFVVVMGCLGWLIGNSYLLAIIGIAGWIVFLGFFLRYLSKYR